MSGPDGQKVPVINRPDYTVYIEQQQIAFMHCDVRRWTPDVRKSLKRDWDAFFEMHGGPLYAVNEPTGCTKHQKFMRQMGFEFYAEAGGYIVFRRA